MASNPFAPLPVTPPELPADGGPGPVVLPRGPRDADLAIDVADVHKTYAGGIKALRGVSLQVRKGEVFGLLGPNGAGKSTLVKILMTVIHPTQCEGQFLGQRIGHKPTLRRVGYLPEHHRFPDYLTAEQVLDFFGAMSGVPRALRKQRTPELLRMVGLHDVGRKKVRQYSKGMRQRLGLAQAMINDPDCLVLDEPTDGVDPEGRRDIRNILTSLRAAGKGVLVNSHILAELELVCDRAAIIYAGRLHASGTVSDLTRYGAQYEIDAMRPPTDVGHGASALTAPPLPAQTAMGGGVVVARDDGRQVTITTGTTSAFDFQPVLDGLRRANWTVTRVQLARPTLEEAFIRVIDRAKVLEAEEKGSAGKGGAA